ncbi:MAG TPA: leucyl aminopeptidase [Streptosporangiaceae bacterium]|nr:leucyl aminopeptidase [Streptosporangiaceae bacterium]
MTTKPLTVSTADARGINADALIIGVTEDPGGPVPAHGSEGTDAALGGSLAAILAALGATGKQDELTKIASSGAVAAPLIVAVGLGRADQGGERGRLESLRRAAGSAVRALRGTARSIALSLPARDEGETEAVALGALLGRYSFTRYRNGTNGSGGNGSAAAGTPDLTVVSSVGAAAGRAQELADAITLVRDLVNTSPADLYPETFAAEAQRVAVAAGLEITVLDHVALAGGGYGGITAVGQGSVHPPRLVRLAYRHPEASKTVVFAGKGITFDSGGLSLKPPKAMEAMKSDMAGAAAVLGALQAIAALRPTVNVVGYLAMAENMPGGGAQRPSDVITIFGGKTVEVLNTDAEGRLVLADALARSAQDAPDLLIDVATLTGAQLVALGPRISGVMGSDEDVAAAIAATARDAGEQAWPMPLPPDLRKGLDSTVADLANVTGERHGGMLVGGLFLKEFVPDGVRWAHVDIAGPAFHEGEPYGYTPKGGTGAAVRMLVQVATDVADGRL